MTNNVRQCQRQQLNQLHSNSNDEYYYIMGYVLSNFKLNVNHSSLESSRMILKNLVDQIYRYMASADGTAVLYIYGIDEVWGSCGAYDGGVFNAGVHAIVSVVCIRVASYPV
jgi:hypothetical protein